ncbi:MAG: hypothetical protein HC769_20480 [Cyanobacteria bacterium CRU_2_1]|nr:hypothetical protein [Cyanobacteria bacterium CRU_2_1]
MPQNQTQTHSSSVSVLQGIEQIEQRCQPFPPEGEVLSPGYCVAFIKYASEVVLSNWLKI